MWASLKRFGGKGRTALTTVKKQNDDNISAPKILRWTKWAWICPNSAKPALNISKFFSLLGFFNSRKCFYSLLFNFCPRRTLNTRGFLKDSFNLKWKCTVFASVFAQTGEKCFFRCPNGMDTCN